MAKDGMLNAEARIDFVYFFDVRDGNPNGDPDAGNAPRVDPETGHGLVSDVALKRKVRDYVAAAKGGAERYNIYIKLHSALHEQREPAYRALDLDDKKKGKEKSQDIERAREWMCKNFYDVRTFGAVMALEVNCGIVRGPVQLNFARSIDAIVPMEVSITRMAVATEKEAEQQSGDNRTMGRKHIVPYALYRAEGYVSAHLAAKTGFSEEDLELLWEALINMFDHDHSAARGKMNARKLIVFKHDTALGNAPAHKLFDLVKVKRSNDEVKPARAFSDYIVDIEKVNAPKGVTLEEKI